MLSKTQKWAGGAVELLQAGQTVQLCPRGHSMAGKVEDGALVTLEPCDVQQIHVGDVVLARIPGRRYSHVVLHLILQQKAGQFLLGSNQNRIDGWIEAENIFGKLIKTEPATNSPTTDSKNPAF